MALHRALSSAAIVGCVLAMTTGAAAQSWAPNSGWTSDSSPVVTPAPAVAQLAMSAAPPPRSVASVPTSLGRLVLAAFVGDLVGAAIGATVAVVVSLWTRCSGNEGWVSGFTCSAGYGYATALGALLGASLGAPISVAATGERRHAQGSGWAGLGGSMLGLALGSGVFGLLEGTTNQPTLATGVGALGVLLGMVLSAAFYDLGRPAPGAPTLRACGVGLAIDW